MLKIEIHGITKTIEHLDNLPKTIREELKAAINACAIKVQTLAKQKVDGPRPEFLGRKTGRLIRSINVRTIDSGASITSTVGTNVSYAAAHEFGSTASGTCNVKEHLRRTKAQMHHDIIKKKWKKKKSPGAITVRAHSRNWQHNLPERSFLRAALRELTPEIEADIQKVISKGIKP